MNPERKPQETTLVIESGLSPKQAIDTGIMVANVRGKISYAIHMVGPRQWRVDLIQGTMEDLRKAVEMARGVKILEKK